MKQSVINTDKLTSEIFVWESLRSRNFDWYDVLVSRQQQNDDAKLQ